MLSAIFDIHPVDGAADRVDCPSPLITVGDELVGASFVPLRRAVLEVVDDDVLPRGGECRIRTELVQEAVLSRLQALVGQLWPEPVGTRRGVVGIEMRLAGTLRGLGISIRDVDDPGDAGEEEQQEREEPSGRQPTLVESSRHGSSPPWGDLGASHQACSWVWTAGTCSVGAAGGASLMTVSVSACASCA